MKKVYLFSCAFLANSTFYAQQDVDLENIEKNVKDVLKKNPLKITGGISANTVFYNSNINTSRDNFTYFLNGNLNVGLYNWSMPINYSLTNQGSKLGYEIPFKFNRLSLNPKYKWIQAHIGDASTTFSPYTYNGLVYTGVGLDLTPSQIPIKTSFFVGRLNKAIEDNDDARTVPSFKRMGYGAKVAWEKPKFKIGAIGFYAKDEVNSILKVPEEKGVLPQENLVLSLSGSYFLRKNLEVFGEYASSGMTRDLRSTDQEKAQGLAGVFFKGNASTEFYAAYNGGVNFNLNNGSVGIKYERIDPGYKTLGSYYFNNDLENISLNGAYNLFKGNVAFTGNIGRQRDNLDNAKDKNTFRWVGAANVNIKAGKKLMFTGSYSNFTMYTNQRLNQFEVINNNPLHIQKPIDSINYKQISQNVNANANYIILVKKNLSQNLNINYSLSDMVNRENGIVRRGGLSRFHNLSVNYAMGFPQKNLNVSTAVNYSNNYAARMTSTIWGPSLAVNKSYFENKLTASAGLSYNTSTDANFKTNVTNFRLSANYVAWEKHNFSLNAIQMFRKTTQKMENPNLNELTLTLGYTYNFDGLNFKRKKKEIEDKPISYKISTEFDEIKFNAEPMEIAQSIEDIIARHLDLMPVQVSMSINNLSELKEISKEVMATDDRKELAKRKGEFLAEVSRIRQQWSAYAKFKKFYLPAIQLGFNDLKQQAVETDRRLDNKYFLQKFGLNLNYVSSNYYKDFKLIDAYVKSNHLKLDQLDRSRLAHYNLLDIIYGIDNYESFMDKDIVRGILLNNKSIYYQYYLDKMPVNDLKNKIVVTIADAYFQQYYNSLEH